MGRTRTARRVAILLACQSALLLAPCRATSRVDVDAGDDAAEAELRASERPWGAISLSLDNDLFAQTDRHYTSGVRLGLLFAPPRPVEEWAGRMGKGVDLGVVAGQKVYTPEDLSARDPVKHDRPYAGWLYAGIVLRLRGGGDWDLGGALPVLDTFELDLGFVGTSSLAGRAQRFVHEHLGSDPPNGWHNQVQQGFAVQLSWLRQLRLVKVDLGAGLSLDVVPHLGVQAGSVQVGARGGGALRVGWGIPGDFGGLEDDALALPLARHGELPRAPGWGVWLVARADLQATAFDVVLDGGFRAPEGHRVRREPLVATGEVGLVISLGSRVMFGYTHTIRSPEFRDQAGPDMWGSVFFQLSY